VGSRPDRACFLCSRMFSQCFTLLAAAAAPISSKQAVRHSPMLQWRAVGCSKQLLTNLHAVARGLGGSSVCVWHTFSSICSGIHHALLALCVSRCIRCMSLSTILVAHIFTQAKIASLDDAGFYDPFHAERARQGADKMNNISKFLSSQ